VDLVFIGLALKSGPGMQPLVFEKQALTARRISGFIPNPLWENLCMPF
jgi:hypothetical protein